MLVGVESNVGQQGSYFLAEEKLYVGLSWRLKLQFECLGVVLIDMELVKKGKLSICYQCHYVTKIVSLQQLLFHRNIKISFN